MKIAKLHNKIQDFSWGSTTYLPELLGYQNWQQKPQAELWMGVHPLGESRVVTAAGSTPLSQYLQPSGDKRPVAGEAPAEPQSLPFLFKVLAAQRPLSLQVHPNKLQAREGFARENAAGIAVTAPERNYKDPNHKPELALALTDFWALCGFLPLKKIERNFSPALAGAGLPSLCFAEHQNFFASLLELDSQQKNRLLAAVLAALSHLAADVAGWVGHLAKLYPGDLGALAPLYLHLLHLQPGQAIFLPSGILHSYLEGSVLELMANSDNVLRGGLTSKHRDVPELLKTLVFAEFTPHIIAPRQIERQRSYYPSAAAEFCLECWHLWHERRILHFPQEHQVMLAFVYRGSVELAGVTLQRGEACIIPRSSGEFSVELGLDEREGLLYVATAKDL